MVTHFASSLSVSGILCCYYLVCFDFALCIFFLLTCAFSKTKKQFLAFAGRGKNPFSNFLDWIFESPKFSVLVILFCLLVSSTSYGCFAKKLFLPFWGFLDSSSLNVINEVCFCSINSLFVSKVLMIQYSSQKIYIYLTYLQYDKYVL